MTGTGPDLNWSIWTALNAFYSSLPFVALVAVGLLAWTIRVGWPVAAAGRTVRSALDGMRRALVAAGDVTELPRDYAALNEIFRTQQPIGDTWAALDRTLIKPAAAGAPYRQTLPARDIFDLQLLRVAGADLRAARAHANTLVGTGLLLTFLGLVLALKAVGETLGAAEPSQVQDGLRALLGAASTKFVFSVVGLLPSLLFAAWLRRETRCTEARVADFIRAVDLRLPPLTPQEIALGTQSLLRGASEAQRDAPDRLAVLMAERCQTTSGTQPRATLKTQPPRLR